MPKQAAVSGEKNGMRFYQRNTQAEEPVVTMQVNACRQANVHRSCG